jgi:hypothetical protein
MENETIQQRLARERDERRKASDSRDLKRQETTGARFTNTARKEEAQRRYRELQSPAQASKKASASPSENDGGGIEFYCWKNGVLGKITLSTSADFTPI